MGKVTDWLEELHHVSVADLPPTALAAVMGVIDSFAAEDGFLPRSGLQVRMLLAAAAADERSKHEHARRGRRDSAAPTRQLS